MMTPEEVAVFLGPTLPVDVVPSGLRSACRPPVQLGDVVRAVHGGAKVIAIIDGYFERVPAVWHKEILLALSKGVHVWGASSMGALRASELHPYGMHGSGWIFEQFRDGALTDDDEVAIFHGPADAGYVPLSEALVNIRASCARAVAAGVIGEQEAADVVAAAKADYYPYRSWKRAMAGLETEAHGRLRTWIDNGGAINQKAADAAEMLASLAANLPDLLGEPFVASFDWDPPHGWLVIEKAEAQRS